MKTIEHRVKDEFARQYDTNVLSFGLQDTITSFGVDSLGHLELLMRIENEFEIDISDREAMKCKTVGDVVSLVENFFKE